VATSSACRLVRARFHWVTSGAVSERHSGAVSERHSGAVSERHSGAVSERPSGAVSERPSGVVSERPSGVVSERPSGVVSENNSGAVSERHSAAWGAWCLLSALFDWVTKILPNAAIGLLPYRLRLRLEVMPTAP
jgi:hypothetical protein